MKFEIDTTKKTLLVKENVNLNVLYNHLKILLGEDLIKYTLIVEEKIVTINSPIKEKEIIYIQPPHIQPSYPSYPLYPNCPITCDSTTDIKL